LNRGWKAAPTSTVKGSGQMWERLSSRDLIQSVSIDKKGRFSLKLFYVIYADPLKCEANFTGVHPCPKP